MTSWPPPAAAGRDLQSTRYGLEPENLAKLYYSRGEYAQAEPLYKAGMAIREKPFGGDFAYPNP